MSKIKATYINALLADATYARDLTDGMTGQAQRTNGVRHHFPIPILV
jgi:hypothetical protein